MISKSFIITPFVEYIWNRNHNEIFLNSYQQNRALKNYNVLKKKCILNLLQRVF